MPRLEDFQAGTPLTEELARMKAGEPPEAIALVEESMERAGTGTAFDNPDRPLTETDRVDLERLTREPGWQVLQRLRKRTLRQMEAAAIVLSQQNPLGNAETIALGWANLEAFRAQMRADEGLIRDEVQKLKRQAAR